MLKKVYNQNNKEFVDVRVLKNLTFRAAPGFKFFLHKALSAKGFSVTEETSGAAVCYRERSITAAIREARSKLQFYRVDKLKEAISKAVEVQRNDKARI